MGRETNYSCPECQVGALHARRASYFTTLEGQLVCVPDFPSWVCDVCGRREYDAGALAELRAMLANDRLGRHRRPTPSTSKLDLPTTSAKPHRRP